MKKFLFIFIKFFVLGLALTSCVNFVDCNYEVEVLADEEYAEIFSSAHNELINKEQAFKKKKAVYESLVGTEWILFDNKKNPDSSNSPVKLIIENDSIIFDNIQHPIDLNTNVFLPNEMNDDFKVLGSHIYFNIDSKIIGFETVSYSYSNNYGILKYYEGTKEVTVTYKKA